MIADDRMQEINIALCEIAEHLATLAHAATATPPPDAEVPEEVEPWKVDQDLSYLTFQASVGGREDIAKECADTIRRAFDTLRARLRERDDELWEARELLRYWHGVPDHDTHLDGQMRRNLARTSVFLAATPSSERSGSSDVAPTDSEPSK